MAAVVVVVVAEAASCCGVGYRGDEVNCCSYLCQSVRRSVCPCGPCQRHDRVTDDCGQ